LTNYEVGWKTTLAGNVCFNAFFEDGGFGLILARMLTQIQNAGEATIKGMSLHTVAVRESLTVRCPLQTEFGQCRFAGAGGIAGTPDLGQYAALNQPTDGMPMLKARSSTERCGSTSRAEAALIGRLPSHTLVDLSTGFDTGAFTVDFYLNNAFDDRAVLARTTECAIGTCFGKAYDAMSQPRTFGVRVGQRF
jgi:outer membrane receptor protein involved in Fe transport